MAHPQTLPAEVHAILAAAQDKIDRLRAIEPYLIDLSMRGNPVGARMGQTLDDQLRILSKLREFGFRHIHLGTLDYEFPDELETGDDFMASLRDRKVDTSGCFASNAMGIAQDDGTFVPDPSQLKLRAYGVPNTLHEISLSREGAGRRIVTTSARTFLNSMRAHWLRAGPRLIPAIIPSSADRQTSR